MEQDLEPIGISWLPAADEFPEEGSIPIYAEKKNIYEDPEIIGYRSAQLGDAMFKGDQLYWFDGKHWNKRESFTVEVSNECEE